MSTAFNLLCLKTEFPIAFWLLLVPPLIGFSLMVSGAIQSYRRYTNIIKFNKQSWKIELRGPAVLVVIGLLLFSVIFAGSYILLRSQRISIDARSVPWKVGDLLEEVMRGYTPSPPSGRVIVEPAARQVVVKGYFTADCAVEFFCKVCDASEELICEKENPWWKLWAVSGVHVRRRGQDTVIAVESVYFGRGLADVNKARMGIIQKVASIFQGSQNCKVELTGYADPDGNEKDNVDLARRRVDAVLKYLLQAGVPEERIVTKEVNISYRDPKEKSRRVDIVLRPVAEDR